MVSLLLSVGNEAADSLYVTSDVTSSDTGSGKLRLEHDVTSI